MQPKLYISLSREELPSLTALFYVEANIDLYGWYLFAQEHVMSAGFFMVEHFYAERTPVLYRSIQDDAYAPWKVDYPVRKNTLRCPVPDAFVHELERMQSAFADDWLFFENDPHNAAEIATYAKKGLPLMAANVRTRKLSRFRKSDTTLMHCTPGTDLYIADFLAKHWQLEVLIIPQNVSRHADAAPGS